MKAGKKFIVLLAAFCMVLGCIAAFPPVVCAAEAEDPFLTRSSAAVMLYSRLQNKDVERTVVFNDITGDESYAQAVLALGSLGVVSADENGNFCPGQVLTRGQFGEMVMSFTSITEGWQAEIDGCKGFLGSLPIREADAVKLLSLVYGEEAVSVSAFTPVFNIRSFSGVEESNSFVEQVNGDLIGFADR